MGSWSYKVISLLDMVPSSSADGTRALRRCFSGGSVHVSFRFKVKENLQRCGNGTNGWSKVKTECVKQPQNL